MFRTKLLLLALLVREAQRSRFALRSFQLQKPPRIWWPAWMRHHYIDRAADDYNDVPGASKCRDDVFRTLVWPMALRAAVAHVIPSRLYPPAFRLSGRCLRHGRYGFTSLRHGGRATPQWTHAFRQCSVSDAQRMQWMRAKFITPPRSERIRCHPKIRQGAARHVLSARRASPRNHSVVHMLL